MTTEFRERASEARTKFISVRVNTAEIELIDAALNPGETRSDFMMTAVINRATTRVKKNKSPQAKT